MEAPWSWRSADAQRCATGDVEPLILSLGDLQLSVSRMRWVQVRAAPAPLPGSPTTPAVARAVGRLAVVINKICVRLRACSTAVAAEMKTMLLKKAKQINYLRTMYTSLSFKIWNHEGKSI